MIADILPDLANFQRQDYLTRIANGTQQPNPYRPRPSNGACLREQTYRGRHYPERIVKRHLQLILDDSSWHEELTFQWLAGSPYHLHSQQMGITIPGALTWVDPSQPPNRCSIPSCRELIHPQDIHGHIDGMITNTMELTRLDDYLIEHKAIGDFFFTKLITGKEWPTEYFIQIIQYLRGLQQWIPILNQAILLIKNKNNAHYLEFHVTYDTLSDTLKVNATVDSEGHHIQFPDETMPTFTGLFQTALTRFQTVATHIRDETLPDRPYEPEDFHCQHCSFQPECWGPDAFRVQRAPLTLTSEQTTLGQEYLNVLTELKNWGLKEKEIKQYFRLYLLNAGHEKAQSDTIEVALKRSTTPAPSVTIRPLTSWHQQFLPPLNS